MNVWFIGAAFILVVAIMLYVARSRPKTKTTTLTLPETPVAPVPCHTLCCDSQCPSLSQYYDPITKSCMERPQMPYGYSLASGPCLKAFQWCSANPPQPKTFQWCSTGLPPEEPTPCPSLCDRFGNSLYYTGFTGVAAMRPAFMPSSYDGIQTFSEVRG